MFATGIENSYATIAGGVRVDEMDKCGHYQRWPEDLALVREMNLDYLRWGPAIYRTHLGPGRYDWSWTDDVLAEMQRLRIEPVLDLCHFGVPDWLDNFQNRDFPDYFAEYAGAFARRYSWIRYWTPINEILITALFSAKYGWWNERLTSDAAFVRATLILCRANLLAMRAIQKQIPEACFVQSESCEYTHAGTPEVWAEAGFHNQRRFLAAGPDLSPLCPAGHVPLPRGQRYGSG
jgi:beta-glucosidase